MTEKYFNSKPGSIFNAAYDVLLGNLNEETDYSHSTGKNENYAKFLKANKDRVGKPMIDGGLKDNHRNADKVNGNPVTGVIYAGSGCVIFTDSGKKTFVQMKPDLMNTSDGTVPWSTWKGYSGNAYISASAGEFKDIAKALAIVAKV
jgi:hypothetical protein